METEVNVKHAVLESSSLAKVAYDADRAVLQLEFRDRAVYQYFGVPAGIHEGLLLAPSKGAYFNRVIRGQFAYIRISERGSLS
jgi:hypothetical protein